MADVAYDNEEAGLTKGARWRCISYRDCRPEIPWAMLLVRLAEEIRRAANFRMETFQQTSNKDD
jgi:hypothetical protein